MSYQERALAIIDRLTDSKAINIRERGTLRRAILLPERPQGEWITREGYDGDEYYECPFCKDAFTLMNGTPKDNNYNFCPNCGSYMKGGAE